MHVFHIISMVFISDFHHFEALVALEISADALNSLSEIWAYGNRLVLI